MGLPWKKFSDGWGYDENPKITRKKIKNHTRNSIDSELVGHRRNKRFGKRKKKVDKPFKIWVKYVGQSTWFHKSGEWRIDSEFAKEYDRDHEFAKRQREHWSKFYEYTKEKPDEAA